MNIQELVNQEDFMQVDIKYTSYVVNGNFENFREQVSHFFESEATEIEFCFSIPTDFLVTIEKSMDSKSHQLRIDGDFEGNVSSFDDVCSLLEKYTSSVLS